MMNKIITILCALLVLSGCVKYDIDEILLAQTEISMSVKGRTVYTFDPDKGQYAFIPSTNEYRMMDDNASSWLIVRFDQKPNVMGDKVQADLEWKTKGKTEKMTGARFKVEKTGENGKLWLWCDDEKMGLIIKDI